jgi:hypothetical protein
MKYHAAIRDIVAAVGLDPAVVTMYSLRHSAIVRELLLNIPIRIVAATHDTSVAAIEAHYSRHMICPGARCCRTSRPPTTSLSSAGADDSLRSRWKAGIGLAQGRGNPRPSNLAMGLEPTTAGLATRCSIH